MVLFRITRILRRWTPILKLEAGIILKQFMKHLENIAGRPLRIEMDSSIGLGQLDAQLLAPSAVTLGPSEVSVIRKAATISIALGSTFAVSSSVSGEVLKISW